MPTVFITSSNRGIGLEFVRQYASLGWRVLAACRAPETATDLAAIAGDVRQIAMDVTDLTSVEAVARESSEPIHLLLNTAGIIGQYDDAPGKVSYPDWTRVMDINLMGPVRVLDALTDRLAAAHGAKAVTLTSGMGSITDVGSPMAMMYRTSKAAVNMAMRCRALQLGPRGITVAVINPGWVKTDMGGEGATLSVADSVSQMRTRIENLIGEDAGTFLDYKGGTYPW